MTATALSRLVAAVARIMPSEAASPHASREWQEARTAWLEATDTLGMTEDDARRFADSLIVAGPEKEPSA